MKKIITLLVVFITLLWTVFAYTPIKKDKAILNSIYLKVDKFNSSKLDLFFDKVLNFKVKYKNNQQIFYLLSELEKYLELKINWIDIYDVLSVTDWDTVKINYNWNSTKLRLIWIDTPESFTSRYWYKECYGDDASDYLKKLLSWNKISIEFDYSQEKVDKYWRLLVYIFLNWENINAKLIEEGYAFEYTYNKKYNFQSEFIEYEKQAKELKKWLWNKNTCNWERKPVWNIEKIETNILNISSVKYYNPDNLDYLNMWFTCEKTKYCKYMNSCEEVTYYFKICWAKTFDWDKDWIPCENICWAEMK